MTAPVDPLPAPHIIVVGDVVTDVVAMVDSPIAHASDTPASISVAGGGAGANLAAWLASTGSTVTLCGVVGDDDAGRARLAELEVGGVRSAIRIDPGATTGSVVVIADGSERTMLNDRGANLRLTPEDVDAALAGAPEAVHLHLSGYALLDEASRPAARHALSAAAARGLSTSVDVASAGPLRRVGGEAFLTWVRGTDVLFANTDEAWVLAAHANAGQLGVAPIDSTELEAPDGGAPGTGAASTGAAGGGAADGAEAAELASALAAWCGVAVVKLGEAGAMSCSIGSDVDAVGAISSEVRDTTGAGDAFGAGFLAAWLVGIRGADALTAGASMAAQAISRVGARPPR